jgi:hypothetical protein
MREPGCARADPRRSDRRVPLRREYRAALRLGLPPVTEAIEAGHSYVLLGEAETDELDARRAVLLELGTEN